MKKILTPNSEVIKAISWNAGNKALRVTYRAEENKVPAVYYYLKVPETKVIEMGKAVSKGRYLNSQIKGKYAFTRLR